MGGNPLNAVDPQGLSPALITASNWAANRVQMLYYRFGPAITEFIAGASGVNGALVSPAVVNPLVAQIPMYASRMTPVAAGIVEAVEAGAFCAVQNYAKVGKLYPTHGQTMSNKQLDKLVKNIRLNGITDPLTVTSHEGRLFILDGHHRALAAPRAGILEVPINRVDLPFGACRSPGDLNFSPGGY